jgi:peptidoglycan/xylan/chitin deacetylase (PgdA/CDA1 family)
MNEVTSYREFTKRDGPKESLRRMARNAALRILSQRKRIDRSSGWVQFPYYHHVFSDERKGFERQLRYLRNFGEFISMDRAVELIQGEEVLNGRYFCVSFDDGFRNTRSNMLEITKEYDVPVIIYLPTDYIGLDSENAEDRAKIERFYPEDPKVVSFLSWSDCREMLEQKVSFGSHTLSHANLSKLDPSEISTELEKSKAKIEEELGVVCSHFACPWGREGIDFEPAITTDLAKRAGYVSFATTDRGRMRKGDDLFLVKRQHLLANWDTYQLKYFFGT